MSIGTKYRFVVIFALLGKTAVFGCGSDESPREMGGTSTGSKGGTHAGDASSGGAGGSAASGAVAGGGVGGGSTDGGSPATPERGAVIAWTSYEAEHGTPSSGAVVVSGASWGEVVYEARGKQAVELDTQGESVEWTNVVAASHATVRYTLPSGKSGKLALYVNDELKVSLPLVSTRMRESKPGSLPGDTIRFFDEVMAPVPGGIPAGAIVRVEKEVSDAVVYTIDFIELETAPAPLTKPDSTWVTVNGNDGAAIDTAMKTASAGSKKVWLPAGSYTVTETLTLSPGIEIRGAGMWHTVINRNNTTVNTRLFELQGDNTVQDLKVISNLTTLIAQNVAIRAYGSNNTVQGVWTEYIPLFLAFDSSNNTVRANRVRNAYKDSIHISHGCSNNLVENNTIRNSGDDSVALVSYDYEVLDNNTIRYNTAELGHWGRGLTIIGGDANVVEHNVVNDCVSAGVWVAAEVYSGKATFHTTNFVVEENTVIRCGNQVNAASGGAMAIYASVNSPMSGRMEQNDIIEPPFHAVQLKGYVGETDAPVYFRYNKIEAPVAGNPYLHKSVQFQSDSNCVHDPNTEI
jgi:parallel beta-helix repeat protein